MGANPVLLLDTLYNNDSVIIATRKIMSDSELAVEYLETAADQMNKYNKVVKYSSTAWCCFVMCKSIATIFLACLICCGIVARQLFGVLILLVGLVCIVAGGVVILSRFEGWLNNKVTDMVEDKLVPQVKQLQASIMELQVLSTITVAINGTKTSVILCYQSLRSLQDTIAAANSLKTKICSKCVFLSERRHLKERHEKITNKTLSQLRQKLESVKTSIQLLHDAVKEEYFRFTISQGYIPS